jgi:hypothetical protein
MFSTFQLSAIAESNSQSPPLAEEEAPFQNTYVVLQKTKYGHGSRWGRKP